MAERMGFALACGLGQGRLRSAIGRPFTTDPFESPPDEKQSRRPLASACFWRRERDSNPRYISVHLISSQGRYNHFDISPYMFTLENEGNNHYSIF